MRRILRRIHEPFMNISVVDLGLVYEVWIGEAGYVHVNMTSSTPESGLAAALAERVREDLLAELPGVQVGVSLLTERRWEPSMMSDEARRLLGSAHELP
ncbi:MAG: metal-sulfur cluster assembly factor [Thiohalomonadaceae bacterium]